MIILLTFILGAIIGSFLNVVICRYNTGKTLGGRSGCFTCGKKLSWYELFPIASFVCLKGKCMGCKSKISLQYPIVEAISGIIFVLLFLKFKDLLFFDPALFIGNFIYAGFFFSLLLIISVYDIRHKIIPDNMVYILALWALIWSFIFDPLFGFYLHVPSLGYLLAGPMLASPFAFLWLVSRGRWMGFGDAKLALGLGWFLGVSAGFSALLFSFWIGAIVGIALIILSKFRTISHSFKYNLKSEISFGPFLALGTACSFFGGLGIISLAQIFTI